MARLVSSSISLVSMFSRFKGMGMKGHGALVLRHGHSITGGSDCHEARIQILDAITDALGLRSWNVLPFRDRAPVICDRKPIAAEFECCA